MKISVTLADKAMSAALRHRSPRGNVLIAGPVEQRVEVADVRWIVEQRPDAALVERARMRPHDTDLVEPLRVIRRELGKGVALLSPTEHPSPALAMYATTMRQIRAGVLKASLFPDQLTDAAGTFFKPSSW